MTHATHRKSDPFDPLTHDLLTHCLLWSYRVVSWVYLGRRHSWFPGRMPSLWGTAAAVSMSHPAPRTGSWTAQNTRTPHGQRRRPNSRRSRSSWTHSGRPSYVRSGLTAAAKRCRRYS